MFAVGKSRGRLEDAVWRDVLDFLQIRDRKVASRKKEGWRKVIGEAVAGKRAETP
jgi:hypothetical protein